jgi:20S proteasome alpha/beta subunit
MPEAREFQPMVSSLVFHANFKQMVCSTVINQDIYEHLPLCSCRYQGHISAALVLGGVDPTGPHLYSVHPHGSTDALPYITMG